MISRAEKTYFSDLTGFVVVVHIYYIVAVNVSYAYYPGRFFYSKPHILSWKVYHKPPFFN